MRQIASAAVGEKSVGDREMGRWGDGEMGRWGRFLLRVIILK
ncbi:hypothetical protein [Moorena sp. SIOASIH]|nr:hypothetical protein [Moorena sp. SIOASIH]